MTSAKEWFKKYWWVVVLVIAALVLLWLFKNRSSKEDKDNPKIKAISKPSANVDGVDE